MELSAALVRSLKRSESLLERTQEILDFVALETDVLEIEVLRSKHEILRQFDETPPESELARIDAYREDAALMTERHLALHRNRRHRSPPFFVDHRPRLRSRRSSGVVLGFREMLGF